MSLITLKEQTEDTFYGCLGSIEILVQYRKDRWSYTMLEKQIGGGWGRHASASNLKEVLHKLAQHLPNMRIFLLLENRDLDEV